MRIVVHMGGLGSVTFDFGGVEYPSPLKRVYKQQRGGKMRGEFQTHSKGETNDYDFDLSIFDMRMSRKTMQAVSLNTLVINQM